MGRIPTGRPKGRPKGTGRLGEVVRLTVRIPEDLYARLEAFAEGRSYHRGDPQLADCVRDALAHYLACPHKRLTINSTVSHGNNIRQIENSTEYRSNDNRQTDNGTVPSVPTAREEPTPLVRHSRQTILNTESPLEPENGSAVFLRQPEKSATPVTVGPPSEAPPPVVPGPAFNPLVYWLQPPRVCGHTSHGAAGNLVKRSTGKCKLCEDAKAAQKKAAPRPPLVTKEE